MHPFVITLRRSSVRTQLLKIFSSETTWPLETKFGGMVHGWSPSKIVSDSPDLQPTWSLLLKIKKGGEIQKIVISETTGSIGTKLCLVLWWPPFKIVSGNPDIQPTWPLLLKTEQVDEILIVFLLNYWANHGFKLC
jgi:hypothetical protein